jgi:uncharacterized protein YuzE
MVHPGIVLDFNGANQVVGIEILRVKDHVPVASLEQIQFAVAQSSRTEAGFRTSGPA